MRVLIILFLFIFVSLSACKKTTGGQASQEVSDTLPEGAIALKYELNSSPRIEGIINDTTIHSMIWDTGLQGDVFIVSDSLKGRYGDSVSVQAGNFKKNLKVVYHNNRDIFSSVGFNIAIIGKDFFKGKIIEVALTANYLREVEDLESVKKDYTCIKIKHNSHLNVPLTVYLQGKKIDLWSFIDTGTPGNLILNYRFVKDSGIKIDTTNYKKAQTVTEKAAIFRGIQSDSIRLGDSYVIKNDYAISFMKYPNPEAMIGMFGCGILDDFVFILDQKDYNLYLKPIND